MATVLITGGTGMIGTALTKELVKRNHHVIILTRDKAALRPEKNTTYAEWNVQKQSIEKEAIEKADVIIHLAGANVAGKRWTEDRKKEIRDSRVKTADLLVKVLKEIPNKVSAVISASAIGYYGPDPEIPNPKPFVETDPPAGDFLASVVEEWENSVAQATALRKRVVHMRTGIVLSREGGAYPEFRKPLRFGLATVLGSGRQVVSWIAIEDLVKIYVQAIENDTWMGAINAVAPFPVTNKELVMKLAKKQKFYLPLHVPVTALKAILGEMSIEVLKSTTVSCDKLQRLGFNFLDTTIDQAIQKLEVS